MIYQTAEDGMGDTIKPRLVEAGADLSRVMVIDDTEEARMKKKRRRYMARTANVFARVEPEVKEQAEQVLDRLGISMSNAVGMFLRQIVIQRGIPFEMKLPAYEVPVAYGSLTKEQFNAEIEKVWKISKLAECIQQMKSKQK